MSTYIINPTDSQRHQMLRSSLTKAGRLEDYENIIELLGPPPDLMNTASPGELCGVNVGIIGGGLAGLTAAFELRKLGANITIIEAVDDRIGGKVDTFYFDLDKRYYGELGPMRIPISHETTWHYINQFELNTLPFVSPNSNNFLYVHNTRIRNDSDNITKYLYPKYNLTKEERNTPWSELSDYAFNYAIKQLPPNIRTEFLKILPRYSPEYLPFINKSIREFFTMLGLSQDAISLITSIDSATGALLTISYDEVAQEIYSLDFENLYRIAGGMVNLPIAFYQSLMSPTPAEYHDIPPSFLGNVVFKLGHYVTGIYKSAYHDKVILKYKSTKNNKEVTDVFDYVVCAIPFSTLRSVEIKPFFQNIKMQAIKEFNFIDAQKTLFLCNRRFWEEDTDYGKMNGGISFTDLPIQSVVYPSDHALCDDTLTSSCSINEPGVLMATYNLNQGAVRLGNEKDTRRLEIIMQNVEEVHGLPRGYLNSVVERYKTIHWNGEPWFLGAISLALPGQKETFAYSILEPEYNNRIFFAGDHTTVKHGWMQGALYSGKLAANSLAKQVISKP